MRAITPWKTALANEKTRPPSAIAPKKDHRLCQAAATPRTPVDDYDPMNGSTPLLMPGMTMPKIESDRARNCDA
jgi:hypothetical protein